MKKRIFMGLTGLAVMAAAITATVTSVNANSTESDLMTKNIEALTQGENIGVFYCSTYPIPLVCVWTSDGRPYDSGYQVWL